MKKLLALLLAMAMVLGMVACGNSAAPAETKAPAAEQQAPAEEPVNKMDQLLLQINVIAGGALAVLEVLLLIWAVLKAKKNKKAAA